MKTIYVAGPMRGKPQFNFPLFDAVSAALREQGHTVISPAEQDAPAIRAASLRSPDGIFTPDMAKTESVGTILGRDTRLVIDDVTDIALLPDWQLSTGARLEVCVALLHGKEFYLVYHPDSSDAVAIGRVSRGVILSEFKEAMK